MGDSDDSTNSIMMDSKAFKAMQFYGDNYETLLFKSLGAKHGKHVLGTLPRHCRFCGKESPDVSFSNDAHAVPAFVGNKVLFSRYECNTCNDRFSEFEDDFAKMTMGDRAVGRVAKRKGFASLKAKDKRSSWEHTPTGVLIKQYEEDGIFTLDPENSSLVVKHDTQPFRRLGVYKCLSKCAYTLLPDSELDNFTELREWLKEKDVETSKVYGDGNHLCLQTFVPGPKPFPDAIIALLKRKTEIYAPYLTFFIAFGNWTYQIFPPCPKKDVAFIGKTIPLIFYPHLYQLQPWLATSAIQSSMLGLDDPERRSEFKQVNMHVEVTAEAAPTSSPPSGGDR
ncbi:hypothetical protein NL532_25815 [Mesorhizobium sp. C120A]|uniref:HNH endonuclease n=1 Tax=unclassified Mesorhizobium TaxID=325217 RepID=UPI0018CB6130|nr:MULTISPECIES: HNH endonuclease [unclassified Mesorhizobium]WJI44006.1 hypothetical protein NL532_25815 [Mesorhizobium sp. C120A]